MRKRITLFVLASALLSSCSADIVDKSAFSTLSAEIDYPEGKTSMLASDGIVRWSEDDRLAVFCAGSNSEATLICGEGTASGSFSYQNNGAAPDYAIYPASAAGTVSGTVAGVSLPATQQYCSNSVFQNGLSVMAGKVENGNVLMKNAVAILELRLRGSQSIRSITLSSLNKSLAGEGSIDMSADEPVLSIPAGKQNSITLSMAEDVALSEEAKPIYFVLPPGVYDDLSFTVQGSEGKASYSTSTKFNLERSKVTVINTIDVVLAGEVSYKWTLNAAGYSSNSDWPTSGKAYDDSKKAIMQWHQTCLSSYYGGAVTYTGTKSNNSYMVKSIWTGDYLEFTLPEGNYAAGSKIVMSFTPVSNAGGPRHWYVQYLDGDEWKYTSTSIETIGGELCAYTFFPMTSTTSATQVREVAYLKHGISAGNLKLRLTCADGSHKADGSTTLLSKSSSSAGIYFKTGGSIQITVSTSADKEECLAVYPAIKRTGSSEGTYELIINATSDWALSSDDSNLNFDKSSGRGFSRVQVSTAATSSSTPGCITVSSAGKTAKAYVLHTDKTFTNPIGKTPDPYVWKEGQTYWFIKSSGKGINLSASATLSNLNSTSSIWSAPTGDVWNVDHVWAPELYRIDGVWYIYYTAGRPYSEEGNYYKQRCGVLRCTSDDPKTGTWEDMGMLDTGGCYAIDVTTFVLKGQRYAVWSGSGKNTDVPQDLYIAKMSNPYTICSDRVKISGASLSWELASAKIQEGPAVLQHGGRTFLIYSTNGSWTKYYRLGMLTLKDGADPMEASSWTKSSQAVFYRCDNTSDADGVNGVGHCCFTKSPDGTEDWIMYHAKNRNDATYDSGRSTYIQKVSWNSDGTPNFGTPCAYGAALNCPSGE